MNPRERWLAALSLEPVDRVPFWPKLNGSYPRAQTGDFCQRTVDEIHQWIGSDPHLGIPGCTREVRKKTAVQVIRNNGTERRLYTTPRGQVEAVQRFDSASQSWHPIKFPVETISDLQIMTEYVADAEVELNKESLEESKQRVREIGSSAITCVSVGTTAMMDWIQLVAGVENGHYLLADHPEDVLESFKAWHRILMRRAEILFENSPADIFYFVENTSTTLISPEQYRRHSYPHVLECAELAKANGRRLVLHMCGHLKALLPDLSSLPVTGFEAFTSPPVGNTRLAHGRAFCPKVCLIGGTNAALWTRPTKTIIAEIERDMAALPHHRGIVLTSAGIMPPACAPETIREVCQWLRGFPPGI